MGVLYMFYLFILLFKFFFFKRFSQFKYYIEGDILMSPVNLDVI